MHNSRIVFIFIVLLLYGLQYLRVKWGTIDLLCAQPLAVARYDPVNLS